MSVTVNAPNALSATLPRSCDADAVRQYFGIDPVKHGRLGILVDSAGAVVPNLNSGVPPYRFDINPALLPGPAQPPAPTAGATQGYSDLYLLTEIACRILFPLYYLNEPSALKASNSECPNPSASSMGHVPNSILHSWSNFWRKDAKSHTD